MTVISEYAELREAARAMLAALKRVDHTVALHGKMDVGTPLYDFVCAAIAQAEAAGIKAGGE